MKRIPSPILPVLLMVTCLVVGACGATSTGGSSGTPSSSAPTATTASSGASTVPVASTAECGKLLSLSEANQDTHPPSPAALIFGLEVSGSALCYYEGATHQPNLAPVVALIFKAYSGGNLSQNIHRDLTEDPRPAGTGLLSRLDGHLALDVTGSSLCAARATERPASFADYWLAAEPRCGGGPGAAGT